MNLIEKLSTNLEDYSSCPFWSWNNELSSEELTSQLEHMKSQGIDSAIIHARTGLVTEYLSEKWFSLIGDCLKKAKELDMRLWVYDENGWPSGFAEGRLLKDDFFAQYIEYKVTNHFDESASAVYEIVNNVAKRIFLGEKTTEYHCVYIKDSTNYADILNPNLTEAFINLTHEEYYKRFEDSFGKELVGFFTDEPQYFRYATPFSKVLPNAFKKEYGVDVFEGLVYLFQDNDAAYEFKHRYYSLLNKMYTNNFYKKIYNWCEEHNCKLTGHSIEETKIAYQMWCCAGCMPSYYYQHVPGIDWLGRCIGNCLSPKQVSSVANQFGKKQVLTETFGCSGWDTNPRDLRRIAEFQYVNGVNSMCQHLYSYSLKGEGKNDYPPSFSKQNIWVNESLSFNTYFKRLSYMLQNSQELATVLVIHPMHSAYIKYLRDEDYESTKTLEESFLHLIDKLIKKGIQFNFGDEFLMRDFAKVDGSKLSIGQAKYDYVIIPEMDNIDNSTYCLLKEYINLGGKIHSLGNISYIDGKKADVDIISNFVLDDLKIDYEIGFDNLDKSITITHRKLEYYNLLYIVNHNKEKPKTISVNGNYKLLDLESLNIITVEKDIEINPAESILLIKNGNLKSNKKYKYPKSLQDITKKFKISEFTDNILTIDYVKYSFDGIIYSDSHFIYSANENLIKSEYNGKLYLKYTFESKEEIHNAKVRLENLNYSLSKINNNLLKLEKSDFDEGFLDSECFTIKEGINEIVLKLEYFQKPSVKHILFGEGVQESLKNCLSIDTIISSLYILGGFLVRNRAIESYQEICGLDNLQDKGLSNFAGKVTIRGEINVLEPTQTQLELTGNYMLANVEVNGTNAGSCVIKKYLDISKFLTEGKNHIKIELVSSLRNMLGPHHFKPNKEPLAVNPYYFNMFGSWSNNESKDFQSEYSLVNFGLDNIKLIK